MTATGAPTHRPLASVALLVALVVSCGGPVPGPSGDAADLSTCPPGDAPWRSAIGKSGKPDDLARLEVTARRASERCPERWEPRWAVGETLFRRSQYAPARAPFDEALPALAGQRMQPASRARRTASAASSISGESSSPPARRSRTRSPRRARPAARTCAPSC